MSTTEVDAVRLELELGTEALPRRGQVWRRFRSHPVGLVGSGLVGFFVLLAVVGPLVAPYAPGDGDLARIRPGFVPGPSAGHPLGLDHQGRDELSRLLHGARSSLVVGVASVALGVALGIAVGATAAAVGGWVDALLMRLMDVMLAIPGLLFAIGLAALLGPSLLSVMVAIGVTGVPIMARLLRASMLVERERDYALAARAVGASRRRLVVAHLLPNCLAPVLVGATLAVGGAVLEAAGLSFLGLGPNDPDVPEWGRMLAESQGLLATSPQLVLFPGAAILLAVLGFNLLGEALRDACDPKSAP